MTDINPYAAPQATAVPPVTDWSPRPLDHLDTTPIEGETPTPWQSLERSPVKFRDNIRVDPKDPGDWKTQLQQVAFLLLFLALIGGMGWLMMNDPVTTLVALLTSFLLAYLGFRCLRFNNAKRLPDRVYRWRITPEVMSVRVTRAGKFTASVDLHTPWTNFRRHWVDEQALYLVNGSCGVFLPRKSLPDADWQRVADWAQAIFPLALQEYRHVEPFALTPADEPPADVGAIHVSGLFTQDDVRQAVPPMKVGGTLAVIAALLVLQYVPVLFLTMPESALAWVAGMVPLTVLELPIAWQVWKGRHVQLPERRDAYFVLGPRQLEDRGTISHAVYAWDSIDRAVEHEAALTLHDDAASLVFVLPRRFFATENDWRRAKELVRRNVSSTTVAMS